MALFCSIKDIPRAEADAQIESLLHEVCATVAWLQAWDTGISYRFMFWVRFRPVMLSTAFVLHDVSYGAALTVSWHAMQGALVS